jgi:flagellar biosynthesis protein FlhG
MARVFAVASGKGGVGKTWFSITLAQALAQHGKRVLLFDGDLGLANIDIQLGFVPPRDLGQAIDGKQSLADLVANYAAGGFDLIAGRSGSGALSQLPIEKLNEIGRDVKQIAGGYDIVLMDLAAGIDTSVSTLAGHAHSCIVVTTDEPTALTDAYALIKVSRQRAAVKSFHAVVNQASSQREGERTYATLLKACQGFLHYAPPLAGIIRRDTRVRDAIRSQTPLLTRYPTSEAASDVMQIALRLLEA